LNENTYFDEQVRKLIANALNEDTGRGDITSELLIPENLLSKAYILIKAPGVLAGGDIAHRVFLAVDPTIDIESLIPDGARIKPGDIVINIFGKVRGILKAERVALNFLQRLSGIASQTAEYVSAISGSRSLIYDTRKTTPGMRAIEKYAVRMGGGKNHRVDLGDAVLIKDNHIAALRTLGMNYYEIVEKMKQNAPRGMKIEAEAQTVEEALDAVKAGVDVVMLDNMGITDMVRAVELIAGRAKVEASGNITLKNIREVAATGVDIISIGALTHSVKALDISLEMDMGTLKLF
jgi:nicotinate-nucleotide pyrophosphorylase (carboxylating)